MLDVRLQSTTIVNLIKTVYSATPDVDEWWQLRSPIFTELASEDHIYESLSDRSAIASRRRSISDDNEDSVLPAEEAPAEAEEVPAPAEEAEVAEAYSVEPPSSPAPRGWDSINRDGMRTLIAQYAGSSIERLREDAAFLRLAQKGGQFVLDLLMAIGTA